MALIAFDTIVPFGKILAKDNVFLVSRLKRGGTLPLGLVSISVDCGEHSQPNLCPCLGCQQLSLLHRIEYGTFPHPAYLVEELVLDGIPLGAIRWVMRHNDVNAQSRACWMRPCLKSHPLAELEPPPSQRIRMDLAFGEICLMFRSHCSLIQSRASSAVSWLAPRVR